MSPAKTPVYERQRLASVRLVTDLGDAFDALDDLVEDLARVARCELAAVTVVDDQQIWFAGLSGQDRFLVPREHAFCAHAILQEGVFWVEDLSRDERFFRNPLVTAEQGLRHYAGVPFEGPFSQKLGAVCVLSRKPKSYCQETADALTQAARTVERRIRDRLSDRQSELRAKAVDLDMEAMQTLVFALIQSLDDRDPAVLDRVALRLKLRKTEAESDLPCALARSWLETLRTT